MARPLQPGLLLGGRPTGTTPPTPCASWSCASSGPSYQLNAAWIDADPHLDSLRHVAGFWYFRHNLVGQRAADPAAPTDPSGQEGEAVAP